MLSGVARLIVNPSSFVTSCVFLPTRAPSLLRRYSFSSVLHAHPPPKRPGLALTSNQLIPTADHRLGFPCCVCSPMHACCCHYPGRVDEPVRSYCCIDFGLPHISGGSACINLFQACTAFTPLRPTCSPSRLSDPLHRRLQPLRCLHDCSDCYRVERTSSRVGISPTVDQRLSRRTDNPVYRGHDGSALVTFFCRQMLRQ